MRSRKLSGARLLAFLLALACGVAAELRPSPLWVVAAVAFLILFLFLVGLHGAVRRRERWFAQLRDLNDAGLSRLDRRWDALPERHSPMPDPRAIAADLDLFGRPALAQLIGPVGTARGRELLARWLLDGASAHEVGARQDAVRDLVARHDLREALAAHGAAAGEVRAEEVEAFLSWSEGPFVLRGRVWLNLLSWLIPIATLTTIALGAAGIVPGSLWLIPVIVAGALSAGPGKAVQRAFQRAFGREGMFHGYPEMLAAIAEAEPESARLKELQHALGAGERSAAELMTRLARLMHLADLRHSGLTYAVAQLLLLWDFHVMRAVERWQETAGHRVREWLALLAQFEVLSGLSTLAHDHPEWSFAEIIDDVIFEADALGHPMLPAAKRVDNDVRIGPPGSFLFITGSNMSGKSTLLRAVGQNTILGLAGAPVCARRLRLPSVELRTSIHVQDSLVEGVSYFMAQLQRLRDVVRAADRAGESGARPVLFLLDEILAGTNSAERRVAATRVIRHLVETGAIGAVTTHDLELGEQPELTSAARPVHFTERVDAGEDAVALSFDYRLREGVATSTNALRLMRVVGLDP